MGSVNELFSSALSSLTGTSIPYTFKEKIVDPKLDQYPDNTSIWTVYNGLNSKGDNAKVTIFEFNLKDPVNLSRDYVSLAKNAFRKAKLLKLPGIVLVVDFIEDENYLYIVTEPVVPLAVYLQESEGSIDADCKTFGIFEVGSTLLLVNQSSCLHGNVSINSVFVTQAGDWRLFGLELTTNLTSDPDQPVYRFSRLMPGYEILLPDEGLDGVRQFPLKLDSFKFGQFIYQVFNSNTTNGLSGVASMNNVPRQLAQYAKKLVAVKPLLRPTVEKFMKESSASVFSKNKLVLFNQELDELKFKNEWEKLEFFKHDLNDFTSSSLTFPLDSLSINCSLSLFLNTKIYSKLNLP